MSNFNRGQDSGYLNMQPSWVDRNGFSDWVVAALWLLFAFVLFQVVAGLIAVGLIYLAGDLDNIADLEVAISSRLDLLFIGNTFGQIVFLGLCTLLVARLHLSGQSLSGFMRFRWDQKTPLFLALSAVLFLTVQPAIVYLGYLNSLLPVPDYFGNIQDSQYQMFAEFLRKDGAMWLALFHIALVPAFAEEILFRSYILRAFQNSWGIIIAIVASGFMFAIFHIQLGLILPLATLGILLAAVTWLSGSVWPAVVAHLVNNGAAVISGTYFPDIAFAEMTPETLPPFWALIASIVISGMIIRYMYVYSNEKMDLS